MASEGRVVVFVAPERVEAVQTAMRAAARTMCGTVGYVTLQHPNLLVAKTAIGGTRIVPK